MGLNLWHYFSFDCSFTLSVLVINKLQNDVTSTEVGMFSWRIFSICVKIIIDFKNQVWCCAWIIITGDHHLKPFGYIPSSFGVYHVYTGAACPGLFSARGLRVFFFGGGTLGLSDLNGNKMGWFNQFFQNLWGLQLLDTLLMWVCRWCIHSCPDFTWYKSWTSSSSLMMAWLCLHTKIRSKKSQS